MNSMLRDAGSATVPPHPLVRVEIDATGLLTVDGKQEPHARLIDSRELAELAVLAVARDHATPLGRGVRVVASTPTEHSTMVVHPDGAVTDLEAHEPLTPDGIAPATRAPHWLATREAERRAERGAAGRVTGRLARLAPALRLPRVSLPSVSLPSVSLPSVSLPSVSLPRPHLPHVSLPRPHLPHVSLPHVEVSRPDLRRAALLALAAGVATAIVVAAVAITIGSGPRGPSPSTADLRAASGAGQESTAPDTEPPAPEVVGATRLARVAVADVGLRTAPGSLQLALESTRRTPVAILVKPVGTDTAPEARRLRLSIRAATTREVTVDDLAPGRYRWTVRAPGQRRLTGYADVPAVPVAPAPAPQPTEVAPVADQPPPVEQPPPSTAPPADGRQRRRQPRGPGRRHPDRDRPPRSRRAPAERCPHRPLRPRRWLLTWRPVAAGSAGRAG